MNHILIYAAVLLVGHVLVVAVRTGVIRAQRRVVGTLHRHVHGVFGHHEEERFLLFHRLFYEVHRVFVYKIRDISRLVLTLLSVPPVYFVNGVVV